MSTLLHFIILLNTYSVTFIHFAPCYFGSLEPLCDYIVGLLKGKNIGKLGRFSVIWVEFG